jgi:hypothetical protein
MIAALLLAAALMAPTAPPDVPALHPAGVASGEAVLVRYAEAVAKYKTPPVLSFEYAIDQSGARDIQQTHRVFRSGNAQRDELLSADGKFLAPPAIHIFLGRRNRYTVEALAPRTNKYTFRYIGSVHDGHHTDAVFATTPLEPAASVVKQVTIDGVTFLPVAIRFTTSSHKGSGVVTFARVGKYWLPVSASATATYAKLAAVEHISFYRYRFPAALPASTFEKPHPLPSFRPTAN